MPVTLRFTPADLGRVRFAMSPVWETLGAVRLLSPEEGKGPHVPWLAAIPRDVDLRPLSILLPRRGYTPDFWTPAPLGPATSFAMDLARVRLTSPRRARAEIARALAERRGAATSELGRSLLDGDPAGTLARLCDLIAAAWETMVEPYWPRVKALLDADLAFQSRRLAEGGIDGLFAELHPTLRWHDGVLTRSRGDVEHRDLAGEGLVLMPSVFRWDQVLVIVEEPWQPTVVYPARGLGTLWHSGGGDADRALARLIGRTRAVLLTGLTEPTATTTLAHRYALAAGTVSEHLGVLRDAGLIAGERHRHEVRYRRTGLGEGIVAGKG
ncbi:ArsR/SmtB family transcription factor [Phytomonospora endophytica]|uniref:DNA-binding transcriptional ArsR family regulator n=1 Tax=Phytomonospora endophytica TaxID=714109 RepID=A0A841G545_9ACTN|nr:DUF5937 family protein [Phytomonospora endophytica]MBB6039879.1 DNA-binding transcriptional ArsR family regulator [Phytomonospora endophytica]GIG71051.1 transcriptional regulator [Phytomonospora endophytica]